jgi:hypothetical protein
MAATVLATIVRRARQEGRVGDATDAGPLERPPHGGAADAGPLERPPHGGAADAGPLERPPHAGAVGAAAPVARLAPADVLAAPADALAARGGPV